MSLALKLLQLFSEITDRDMRQTIVQLVEIITRSYDQDAPTERSITGNRARFPLCLARARWRATRCHRECNRPGSTVTLPSPSQLNELTVVELCINKNKR